MDMLKKKRKVMRAAFARLCNTLEEVTSRGRPDEKDDPRILADLELLREKADDLMKLDDEIMDLLLRADTREDELDKEMQGADEYAHKYKRLNLHVQRCLSTAIKTEDCDNSMLNVTKRKFKLPTLELRKFGGDVKDWLTFWGQFKKIDGDPDIDEADKFQYLLQATSPNTRAREVVESFPPIASNYNKAIECLKARFGREDLLVEFYVRELLKLTMAMNSKEVKVTLSSLYDRIETQLRALETLGVATDKYAAMLFPLVESCLMEEVLRAWQRSGYVGASRPNGETRLESLMGFLKSEVENEERITMAIRGFSLEGSTSGANSQKTDSSSRSKRAIPTTAGLVNCKFGKITCVFCEGSHTSESCPKAQSLSFAEKRNFAVKKGCCFACLKPGHCERRCRAILRCVGCSGRHVSVMCKPTEVLGAKGAPVVESSLSNIDCNNLVFLQTIMVTMRGERDRQVRVLMDPGSQRSYVKKDTARSMKYAPIGEEELIHGLFGGEMTKPRHHFCYKVRLRSLDNKYACNFEALDEENICSRVPALHAGTWLTELKSKGIGVCLEEEKPIEVLIGADVYGKLLTGRREILQCGLVAIETYLGWVVTGKMQSRQKVSSMMALTMFAQSEPVNKLWELDVLGIQDPQCKKSKEERERAVRTYFLDTVRVNEEGRYEVRLPWIEGHPPVPRNFNLAKRRLENTIQKLAGSRLKAEYEEVLEDWLRSGIIEEVPISQRDEGHYLPHRPVVKEHSTTKLRPVFDASAREQGCPSLNQCLEKGTNLIEIIPALLLRFRLHQIGVIADIKRAFLQVSLGKEDRDVLRFLWVNAEGDLRIFRHARVAFGVTSSPFLLGAVIDFHLKRCIVEPEQSEWHDRGIVEKLRKSFYVDNCVTSVPDHNALHLFMKEATEVFAGAKFELRGWEHSDPDIEGLADTAVLGLCWDKKEDTLAVANVSVEKDGAITRRAILSVAQRVFDPIGFTCPVSLCPKLLLQQCWALKGDWDQEVPDDVRKVFLRWLQDLPLLQEVKIPRWLMGVPECVISCSLHTFCDASKTAYAAAVFIRFEYSSCVQVQLIQAKARVAPVKTITIPRLELLAATIGTRLATSIVKELEQKDIALFFWSDSSAVITWIKRDDHWGVFVWNRVQEIRELTSKESWRHVPGFMNPADLPSRGCTVPHLIQSRWWEGPYWLKLPAKEWPSGDPLPDEEIVGQERRKSIVSSLLCKEGQNDWYYAFSHNYDKIVSVLAWVLRFVNSCRKNRAKQGSGKVVQWEEIMLAEKCVIRYVQQEAFAGPQDDRISRLCPYMDNEGIIRLRTKVVERADLRDFGIPAILPSSHPVVEMLVLRAHGKARHVGVQGLLSLLRERFWILKGRKTIRAILTKCVVCRRHSAKHISTIPPALPEPRVRDAAVFETTGVDMAGPLFLKDCRKAWVCLYTCAVYRAVHLELTSSLSTESFLQTFRRFVARRGRPAIIYSDNGTNFRGTDQAFRQLDWEKIIRTSTIERIDWRFNPPTAAWWGGWWERLIRLLKQLLKRTLARASLTYEELETVLCDCEAVMNSRPLTYVSEDVADLAPLTPNMFLMDLKEVGLPDCDAVDAARLTRRAKYRQEIKERLRDRFRKEYLGQLMLTATKASRELLPREVVLIGTENSKRVYWPLAVVEELIPGRDGKVRLVKLRTKAGMLLRPVQRIYPLEIYDEGVPIPKQEAMEVDPEKELTAASREKKNGGPRSEEVYTRGGRKVKPPPRFLE
jgi:hypothetical protein